MNIAIARHAEGVTLNHLEYIMDDSGTAVRKFESEEQATEFLKENGVSDEQIEDLKFVNLDD